MTPTDGEGRIRLTRFRHLMLAVRLVWKSAAGWTAAGAVLGTIQAVLPLANLYLIKLLVDTLTRGLTGRVPGLSAAGPGTITAVSQSILRFLGLAAPGQTGLFQEALFYIGLAAVVAAIGILCRSLATYANQAQSQTVADYVSGIIHRQSVALDLAFYEDPAYFDTLHRAQAEAPYRPLRIVNGLMSVGQNGLSLAALGGLLMTFHWAVPLVLFLVAAPGVIVRIHFSRKFFLWQRRRTESERRAWYYHSVLTGDGSAKEVRLFNLGGLFSRWFQELRASLRREGLHLTGQRTAADGLLQGGSLLAVYGGYALAAWQTIAGRITLGDLVMFTQAFQRSLVAMQELMTSLSSLYDDSLFLSNLQEFLAMKPEMAVPDRPRAVPRPLREGIVFNSVSFAYPREDHPALSGVNLRLGPGEVIALVGANGSGKTTLIKLLCRLYDPGSGSISWDGLDLRELDPAGLRRAIGVVFQDYGHYSLTARRNIWLGDVALDPADARVADAARQAGADPVIRRLPQGYDTPLSYQFEGGHELSVGEWQKIALARAFLRDAPVIVLDEPTSSMDAEAEYEVFQAFRELLNDRAAVLISHRFSTVRMADRIYVLERGQIVEDGSHAELMARAGVYARLFRLQSQYYRE